MSNLQANAKILLLEDDLSLGETLFERLLKKYQAVTWVKSIAQAKEELEQEEFELLILDVGLPDGSGFDLAHELAGNYPIIFLTALNSAEDRLKGYELGGHEYIPKPFHLKELLIRIDRTISAHVKQVPHKTPAKVCYHFEGFIVDAGSRSIEISGQRFYPSQRDFDILTHLITSAPNVVSREELLDRFWGDDAFPTNRTVDNTILRIRQFLGNQKEQVIKSVRGIGYQWLIKSK